MFPEDGKTINYSNKKDLYNMRKKIGLLFQSGALFDSMTVEENVGFSLFDPLEGVAVPPYNAETTNIGNKSPIAAVMGLAY